MHVYTLDANKGFDNKKNEVGNLKKCRNAGKQR